MQQENIYLNPTQTIQYKEVNNTLYQRKYNPQIQNQERWLKVGLVDDKIDTNTSDSLKLLFQVDNNVGELIQLQMQ